MIPSTHDSPWSASNRLREPRKALIRDSN
jgi:hypothetical protein